MESVKMILDSPSHYHDAHLDVNFNDRSATLDGRRLVLTRKECELLLLFVQNPSEVIPREALLMRVWGLPQGLRTRTLDVHIRRLRRKLGSYGWEYIETIFGIGYRFQPLRTAKPFQPGLPPSTLGSAQHDAHRSGAGAQMKFGMAVVCSLYALVLGSAQDNTTSKARRLLPIGLEVGQKAPAFSTIDQFGHKQSNQSLLGMHGTVLLFFRSADW